MSASTCARCGARFDRPKAFCSRCGERMEAPPSKAAEPEQMESAAPEPEPEKPLDEISIEKSQPDSGQDGYALEDSGEPLVPIHLLRRQTAAPPVDEGAKNQWKALAEWAGSIPVKASLLLCLAVLTLSAAWRVGHEGTRYVRGSGPPRSFEKIGNPHEMKTPTPGSAGGGGYDGRQTPDPAPRKDRFKLKEKTSFKARSALALSGDPNQWTLDAINGIAFQRPDGWEKSDQLSDREGLLALFLAPRDSPWPGATILVTEQDANGASVERFLEAQLESMRRSTGRFQDLTAGPLQVVSFDGHEGLSQQFTYYQSAAKMTVTHAVFRKRGKFIIITASSLEAYEKRFTPLLNSFLRSVQLFNPLE